MPDIKDISKVSPSGVKYADPDQLIRQPDVRATITKLKAVFRSENGNGNGEDTRSKKKAKRTVSK